MTTPTHCPVCAADLDPAGPGVRRCPRCDTPHHGDCWEYAQGCAVYGCRPGAHAPAVLPVLPTRPQLAAEAAFDRLLGLSTAALSCSLTAGLALHMVADPLLGGFRGAPFALTYAWALVAPLFAASLGLFVLSQTVIPVYLHLRGLVPPTRALLPAAPASAYSLPERVVLTLGPGRNGYHAIPHLILLGACLISTLSGFSPDRLAGDPLTSVGLVLAAAVLGPGLLAVGADALDAAARRRFWLAATPPDARPPIHLPPRPKSLVLVGGPNAEPPDGTNPGAEP